MRQYTSEGWYYLGVVTDDTIPTNTNPPASVSQPNKNPLIIHKLDVFQSILESKLYFLNRRNRRYSYKFHVHLIGKETGKTPNNRRQFVCCTIQKAWILDFRNKNYWTQKRKATHRFIMIVHRHRKQ